MELTVELLKHSSVICASNEPYHFQPRSIKNTHDVASLEEKVKNNRNCSNKVQAWTEHTNNESSMKPPESPDGPEKSCQYKITN